LFPVFARNTSIGARCIGLQIGVLPPSMDVSWDHGTNGVTVVVRTSHGTAVLLSYQPDPKARGKPMNTNSTDPSIVCQAERPEYLSVQFGGKNSG
jgi:hypothetical protein